MSKEQKLDIWLAVLFTLLGVVGWVLVALSY